jgi:hypothetical protein
MEDAVMDSQRKVDVVERSGPRFSLWLAIEHH